MAKQSKSGEKTARKRKRLAPKPLWILRAERAFRRVAKNLRAESKRTGIPLAVWKQTKPKKAKS